MIIKELFDQITFEELYPQLKSYVKGLRCLRQWTYRINIHRFREAYDRLKLLKPNGKLDSFIEKIQQNGVVTHKEVEVICYHDSDKGNTDLSIDLEGSWEYNLFLELVLQKLRILLFAMSIHQNLHPSAQCSDGRR